MATRTSPPLLILLAALSALFCHAAAVHSPAAGGARAATAAACRGDDSTKVSAHIDTRALAICCTVVVASYFIFIRPSVVRAYLI